MQFAATSRQVHFFLSLPFAYIYIYFYCNLKVKPRWLNSRHRLTKSDSKWTAAAAAKAEAAVAGRSKKAENKKERTILNNDDDIEGTWFTHVVHAFYNNRVLSFFRCGWTLNAVAIAAAATPTTVSKLKHGKFETNMQSKPKTHTDTHSEFISTIFWFMIVSFISMIQRCAWIRFERMLRVRVIQCNGSITKLWIVSRHMNFYCRKMCALWLWLWLHLSVWTNKINTIIITSSLGVVQLRSDFFAFTQR